jgi:hypothetical protein
MSAGIMADLMLRLRANSAELEKGINQANKSLGGLEKNSKNIGGQMVSAFAKVSGALIAVKGAVEGAKFVINSTQGTADAFEATMGGLKTGTQAFGAAIANLDFDNLINGFLKGYKAGKAYTEQLDDIADKQLALGIIEAETALEIAKQQRILKDETSSSVEKAAAELKIRELTSKQMKLQLGVAEQKLKAEEDVIKSMRAGKDLTEEEKNLVTDYVKNYIFLTDEQKKTITDLGKSYQAMTRARGAVGAYDEERRVVRTTKAYNDLVAQADDVSKKYASVADVLNKFTDESRERWQQVYVSQIKVEEEFVKMETLTDKQAKKIETVSKEEQKNREKEIALIEKKNLLLGLTPIEGVAKTADLPKVAPEIDATKLSEMTITPIINETAAITGATLFQEVWTAAAVAVQDALSNTAIESQTLFAYLIDTAVSGLQKIGETLAEGGESFSEFSKNALSSIKNIIGGIISQGVAGAVANALQNPALKIAPYLIPVFAGLAAGLAKTAFNSLIPKFAEGGIISGPTVGMLGEYPGVQSNPEIVGKLSDFRDMLGDIGLGEVRFVIEQNQLVGILQKANNKNIYF